MTSGSVYDAVGGDEAFLALARAFHERALADPSLNHPFSHPGHPQHVERLAAYWAEALGGPPIYSSAMRDQSAMLLIHAHDGAGHDFGERFVACFVAALDDAAVPDDPELRAVLRAYMEWAVDDVLQYAPRESVIPDKLDVPKWAWDGRVTA